VRDRRTDEDIARKVATSGSGATLFPDPEVATFRALSVAVPRLPTFSLFLSYYILPHHRTIAHAVPNDLTQRSNEVSNLLLPLNSLLTTR